MTTTARALAGLILVLVIGASAPCGAAPGHAAGRGRDASVPDAVAPEVSRLAFRRVGGGSVPRGLLAQRVIDRQWGLSEDSIYVEIELPGWKSEPLAGSLSALLPGAGQFYTGQRSAWVYAAIEVAGWGGRWWHRRDARRLGREAAGIAGPPAVAASGWSFERWAAATQGDPADIAALYAADREAFYDRIVSDPGYLAGWGSADARTRFDALRIRSDQRLSRSRLFSTGLWLNHLVAAVHALRAARDHNLPIRGALGIKLDGRIERRVPQWSVALEGSF